MVGALVPLKDLVVAKTRLGGLLRPAQRRALAQAMVEDVLTVLCAHPLVEQVALLSDDPGAHLLAGQYGLLHVPESQCPGTGLNAALEAGVDRLAEGRRGPPAPAPHSPLSVL